MVGTGILSSLGFQVAKLPSGFVVMMLWLLGGLISFCGAVNYAELTAAFPRSGGEYQLLSRIYHPSVGFLAGWVSLSVAFPAPVAAAALVFGQHMCDVAGGGSPLVVKLAAAGLVVLVTGAHMISVMFSGRFQWMATGFKIVLLLLLAGACFIFANPQPVHFTPQTGDGGLLRTIDFSVSLIWVLYAYSGWNAACYIAGEVERPERNIPRALFIGTGVVTLLYLIVNAAMLWAVPMPELARGGDHLMFLAGVHSLGETGGRVVAGLIALGLASAVSAMMWAGPRVNQQMGADYPFLSILARTNAGGVPWVGVLLQSILALALIFTLDVEAIVMRTSFLMQLILLVTIFGVFYLRHREPDLPRPYRAWGYPWTAIIFFTMVGMTLGFIQWGRPDDSKWGLGILVIGIAFYFASRTPGVRNRE